MKNIKNIKNTDFISIALIILIFGILITGLTATSVETPIGKSTQIYENKDGVTVEVDESISNTLLNYWFGTVTFRLTKDGKSKLVDVDGEIEHKGNSVNDIKSITKQKVKVTRTYNFILKWQETYTTNVYTVTHKDNEKALDVVSDLITE